MKNLLLIDFNNLVYRFPFVMPNLYHEGIYTGGLYGFVKSLCSCINKLKPARIIVVDDHPPYKKWNSKYKSDRVKDFAIVKKVESTKELCLNFLCQAQIPVIKSKGYEADDIIAEIVNRYSMSFDEIIIFSNDSDMYQLFKFDNIVFWKDGMLFYKKEFLEKYPKIREDELPYEWISYLALTGGHNGLPKPAGIGPVRAMKIIREGTIEKYFESKAELKSILKCIRLPYDSDSLSHAQVEKIEAIHEKQKLFCDSHIVNSLNRNGIKVDFQMEKALMSLGKEKNISKESICE